MCNTDGNIFPQHLVQFSRRSLNGINSIVNVIDLTAADQLLTHCVCNHIPIVLHNERLNRLTVSGRLFDNGHVPNPGQ